MNIRWLRLSHEDTTEHEYLCSFSSVFEIYVWSSVWSIKYLAQWGDPARTDFSLHVSKIIPNLILSLERVCIWFNTSVGLLCLCCLSFYYGSSGFLWFQSHLSPCLLLHFHSVYKNGQSVHTRAARVKIRTKPIGQGFHLC